jgi:hypothetical protein
MVTSKQCRAHAAECRALVPTAASPQKKTILLDLARHWDLAGKDMEKLEQQKGADAQQQPACVPAGFNDPRIGGRVCW